MIDFGAFRAEDGTPIYLQIIKYLKQGVVSGAVADGDELPSRRVLSALLGLNPNTVQKACRMLEEEGLLVSHAGAKSCGSGCARSSSARTRWQRPRPSGAWECRWRRPLNW